MTLTDMLADLYRKLNYASTPSTDVTTRLTSFLNEIQRRTLGMPGMEYLRQGQITFASAASTAQYSLPPDVARIIAIRDATNDLTLKSGPWLWYTQNEPDPAGTTGIPSVWVPVGQVCYATPPTDASALYVDSTSASDVGTCYVEGIRTGGYPFSASVTMTGTTAVAIGAWTDIIGITKFNLSASAVGTVTLHEDAEGGTELARIPIGQTNARYLRIAMWPTPASAVTYTLDYLRQVQDLENPNDESVLPQDFHWVLVAGAKMLEYEKTDDRRYPAARDEYYKGLRDMRWFVVQQADGAGPVDQPSQLGAWYPAGS